MAFVAELFNCRREYATDGEEESTSNIGWACPWNVSSTNKDTPKALLKALYNGLFIEGIGVGFFKDIYGYYLTGRYVCLKHAINTRTVLPITYL